VQILELSYACLAEKVWLFMFLFPPRAESSEWREYQTQRASSVGASTIQVKYNRLERDAETEVLPECLAQDLGVLARVPLASGLLSGRYQGSHAAGDGSHQQERIAKGHQSS